MTSDRHPDTGGDAGLGAGEGGMGAEAHDVGGLTDRLVREQAAKVDRLRAAGVDPYARSYQPRTPAGEIIAAYGHLAAGEETQDRYRVAGRVMSRREHGKAAFLTVRDGWDDLQVYARVDVLGEQGFGAFTDLDLGDIIGCEGRVFRTRRGELSLTVESWTLLTKALRPPAEKFHGLQDVETRYRQRYADLIANPEVAQRFRMRSTIISGMRRYLEDRGFIEVETPILQPLPGGALARPFVTHHNALDVDLYLRIAPELYLKRVMVGGFDKVFEIGRNFRNEGISLIHNPEFTMMELYWAYVDYKPVMELVEQMVSTLAQQALGTMILTVGERELDLTPPWPRVTVDEALRRDVGMSLAEMRADPETARDTLRRRGVDVETRETFSLLVDKALKHLVYPNLLQPVFIIDHPVELSPLAKKHPADPTLVERFQPIIAGREVGNAFSELNDPMDQRRRFEEQARNKAAGDEEAMVLDEDFLRALEYGMPPTGGLGMGVDRLVMLFLGVDSIRDVVLFPQLRPETFGS